MVHVEPINWNPAIPQKHNPNLAVLIDRNIPQSKHEVEAGAPYGRNCIVQLICPFSETIGINFTFQHQSIKEAFVLRGAPLFEETNTLLILIDDDAKERENVRLLIG